MKIKSLLVALSLTFLFSSCAHYYKKFYTDPEKYYQSAILQAPFDAIIVPGFPHYKDSMSFVVQNRVTWACYLYKKGIAKNIIFSGSAVYTPYVESKIMAQYAEQMGVPSEHIFIEEQAEHSTENLYYSYVIAQKQGFKTIAVSSDPVQSSFLKSINDHRFQLKVEFIPIIYDSLKTFIKIKPDFNQEIALTNNFVSIVDRQTPLQRLRGTRGKKVKQLLRADSKNAQ